MIEVLSKFSNCVERASVDEAFIDLTEEVEARLATVGGDIVTTSQLPNTFVSGYDDKKESENKSKILFPFYSFVDSVLNYI